MNRLFIIRHGYNHGSLLFVEKGRDIDPGGSSVEGDGVALELAVSTWKVMVVKALVMKVVVVVMVMAERVLVR